MLNEKDLGSVVNEIAERSDLPEEAKRHIMLRMQQLKTTKVNILITGATGSGKSSTINALFNTEVAKVGQGVDPETIDIAKYELNNVVLWDSPGLGDGKEADNRHAKNIIGKLREKDKNGDALIDLVLVILDGSSRDLGTSFELINQVIIPNLGENTDRLLVAINQCDVAMKGRNWNNEKNCPEQPLIDFLEEKVESTRRRIKEATGVDITPIYYSAGFKDGNEQQHPYNLSKLLLFIVQHTKSEKRAVIANDLNRNKQMWKYDDGREKYIEKAEKSMMNSVIEYARTGSEFGETIGGVLGGKAGAAMGKAVGAIVGGVVGLFAGIF